MSHAIIARYISRQLLTSMAAVTLILLLIFMSGRFIRYLADVASGRFSADVLFAVMGYRLPGFLELILPLAFFLGILLAYGRMYMESEMTVLSACGMSPQQLVVITMIPASVVMAIVAALSLYMSPWGVRHVERIFYEQSKVTEFELLVPGRFQSLRDGNRVTYTESLSADKTEMQSVFIAERDETDGTIAVLVAERGRQEIMPETGTRYIILDDGARYDGQPGRSDYSVVTYQDYGLKLTDSLEGRKREQIEGLPTASLWRSATPEHEALLQWRLSLPLLVPVVALIAIAMSRVNPRQGRFFHLLPAMLVYLAYLGLLIVARKQLEKERLPEWLGLWVVHIAFFILALFMIFGPKLLQRLFGSKKTLPPAYAQFPPQTGAGE
ncbi:LPS export ABC transporter permease LptF [Allohahella sp. A8]|uniref:LPS export ABC transporter permease LptF n=1 Tax=Allohahella sp. A8 TaxID=3141461 RepID=UPI000C0A50AF|nr:LPS export ABC transporter permease LptF [Hahellaceae bacterium]|tara:strand:- start:52070 stop:53218 length:1149 start_codon:yes stop_codon:yes gene_type:complete